MYLRAIFAFGILGFALVGRLAVLHMEFTPRGEQVWISSRDDNVVRVYDPASFARIAELKAEHPSGILLSIRAFKTGF